MDLKTLYGELDGLGLADLVRRREVTPLELVDEAIRRAQAHDGPALVWFEIEQTQNVLPMMPAGKGLSDLIEDWGDPTTQGEGEEN